MTAPAQSDAETNAAPLAWVAGETLRRDLTALAKAEPRPGELRRAAVLRFKAALKDVHAGAAAALAEGYGGLDVARALSRGQDELVRALYDFTVKHLYYAQVPSAAERIAIVATGGYGRGALAPGSDVDLLFILPYKQTAWGESVTEAMLYTLWDLGLKVGHATRSIDECLRQARSDMTVRTSLLEARFIGGDLTLFLQMKTRFDREIVAGGGADFVEAKLDERDARHKRAGESRYLVEPNVKDGKGGLRDLHTLFWIAKYLYRVEDVSELVARKVFTEDEMARFAAAEEFLWRVRCHLHLQTGRAEERLSFDIQREIARRMGYGDEPQNRSIERFMTDYFRTAKDVGDLTRIFCAVLEEQNKKSLPVIGRLFAGFGRKSAGDGFFIEGARLNIEDESVFARDPLNLLRLFAIADERGTKLHPDALRAVTRALHLIDDRLRAHPEANRLFLSVLASPRDPETVLRWMNEAGVFGRFVPAFGRIVAAMQFNMYHHYTVDEHLIRAIGCLSGIERGIYKDEHPLAHQLIGQVKMRNALFVAMLLHDIAKNTERDHSEEGEEIALELCPRLGLSEAETLTVAWLVRHHLVMSDVAQKRDLSDPKTIEDFVTLVQSPERLRLLLILTVADIRAVGPGVFNGWKGQLLRDLYHAAEERMLGGAPELARPQRIAAAKAALETALTDLSPAEREAALQRHYDAYWLSLPHEMHLRHARFLNGLTLGAGGLALEARADAFRAVTEITVAAEDHPGLFSRLAGGFALAGANIVDAKIFTAKDGLALDVFWVQDQDGAPFALERLPRLEDSLRRTLRGEVLPRAVIDARRVRPRDEAFTVAPDVIFDNAASHAATLIEINARDRPGLLHDLTRALFQCGLSIHSAVIATYGERAVDVFYVKDLYGHKVTHAGRLNTIESALLRAMGGAGARAARETVQPAG